MSKLKKTISIINTMLINKCNKATILTYDDNVIKLLNVLVDFNEYLKDSFYYKFLSY